MFRRSGSACLPLFDHRSDRRPQTAKQITDGCAVGWATPPFSFVLALRIPTVGPRRLAPQPPALPSDR